MNEKVEEKDEATLKDDKDTATWVYSGMGIICSIAAVYGVYICVKDC